MSHADQSSNGNFPIEDAVRSLNEAARERVRELPPPAGQKFAPGARVFIARDLGPSMAHFPKGVSATVLYTYAHAYGGDDLKSYCLEVDHVGEVSWYEEWQLSAL